MILHHLHLLEEDNVPKIPVSSGLKNTTLTWTKSVPKLHATVGGLNLQYTRMTKPLEDLHANAIVKRDIKAKLVQCIEIEFRSTFFLIFTKLYILTSLLIKNKETLEIIAVRLYRTLLHL